MPTATWRRWPASPEGIRAPIPVAQGHVSVLALKRRHALIRPRHHPAVRPRNGSNPTARSRRTPASSTAYGGPFNQLGSSSIRFVIRSSPSTLLGPPDLARSELHGDHDASADVGAAERSGMRPERLADREITELHSGGPPLSDRNAVTRRSHPTGRVQRRLLSSLGGFRPRPGLDTRGPRRGNDSQRASSPIDHRDDDGGGARSIVAAPYALVAKPHSCRYLRRCPCLCRPAPFAGRAAR